MENIDPEKLNEAFNTVEDFLATFFNNAEDLLETLEEKANEVLKNARAEAEKRHGPTANPARDTVNHKEKLQWVKDYYEKQGMKNIADALGNLSATAISDAYTRLRKASEKKPENGGTDWPTDQP